MGKDLKLGWFDAVVVGYFLTTALAVSLFITFLWAYFFNDFLFAASINLFGEADIELVVICIVMVANVLGFYGLYRDMRRRRIEVV